MNAARVIERAAEAGIQVSANGGKLRLVASHGTVPTDIVEAFRSRKGEVLALLKTRERLTRIARAAGLPAELVHGIEDADISACAEFSDTVLADYLRSRCERFALTPLQWRALSALRDEPGAARAMIGDKAPDGTYRLAIALRRPGGKHVVGELVLDKAPPLTALAGAIP